MKPILFNTEMVRTMTLCGTGGSSPGSRSITSRLVPYATESWSIHTSGMACGSAGGAGGRHGMKAPTVCEDCESEPQGR